jgi:hypothetical protein
VLAGPGWTNSTESGRVVNPLPGQSRLWLRGLPVQSRLVAQERALARAHSGRAAGSRPLRGARCHSRARTARRSCFTPRSRDRVGCSANRCGRTGRGTCRSQPRCRKGHCRPSCRCGGRRCSACRPVLASPSERAGPLGEKAGPLRGSRAPRVRGEGATRGMASARSWRALRMEASLFQERVRNEPSSPGRCQVQRLDRRRGPSRGNHALRFQYVDGAFIRTG